jgi:predicted dehydrogenase
MNELRIALVGCGKIADQHVQAIRRTSGGNVVAVCDREPLMARQLAERFDLPAAFADVGEMLRRAVPEVAHIITPPQGHYSLATQCLEAGCHVYLEKPFTVTAPEAEALIQLAETRKLKITAGHNYQFTLEMLEMRRLIAENFLGGRPVHLESHWPYDLSDAGYVGPLLGSKTHWVRQLPGQLFHNLISHGIAKLAEFLGDQVQVTAQAHQSGRLKSLGGQEVQDELRVLLRDEHDTTAFFCFSTQIKPGRNFLRICGPKNSLLVDHSSGTLTRLENKAYKSYLTFFVPPLVEARQNLRNTGRNILDFVQGRLHQDSGMKELIERFYRSIRNQDAPPLPYREIILTARIMDEIFAQIKPPVK